MTTLKTGSHYWYRQRYERIWRTCYIGQDHDHQQWMWCTGITKPLKVADLELEYFDFQEITPPREESPVEILVKVQEPVEVEKNCGSCKHWSGNQKWTGKFVCTHTRNRGMQTYRNDECDLWRGMSR